MRRRLSFAQVWDRMTPEHRRSYGRDWVRRERRAFIASL